MASNETALKQVWLNSVYQKSEYTKRCAGLRRLSFWVGVLPRFYLLLLLSLFCQITSGDSAPQMPNRCAVTEKMNRNLSTDKSFIERQVTLRSLRISGLLFVLWCKRLDGGLSPLIFLYHPSFLPDLQIMFLKIGYGIASVSPKVVRALVSACQNETAQFALTYLPSDLNGYL